MANQETKAKARENQRMVEEKRRLRHLALVGLLKGKKTRPVVISYAKSVVRKWRRRGLCSDDYVQAWRRLLDGSISDLVVLMGEQSNHANRLRQNSPFSCFLIRCRRHKNAM